MRRERGISRYLIISIILIVIAIFLLIGLINRNIKNVREKQFAGDLSKLNEEMEKSDTVSSQIGKTVNDVEKEENKENKDSEEEIYEVPKVSSEEKKEKNKDKTDNKQEKKNNVKQTNSNIENKEEKEKAEETNAKAKKEEVKFSEPIKGEIIKEFAKDSLVYSNTLQEWVTHNGIDIKADKTSIVKAAAKGKVTAIKNDPRYGLTVIITHDNGYQTVYSNLLTAEFVIKGENVEAGQSIGTVGNSASFEIADEYHLHFELLKNNEYINPTTYINFK